VRADTFERMMFWFGVAALLLMGVIAAVGIYGALKGGL